MASPADLLDKEQFDQMAKTFNAQAASGPKPAPPTDEDSSKTPPGYWEGVHMQQPRFGPADQFSPVAVGAGKDSPQMNDNTAPMPRVAAPQATPNPAAVSPLTAMPPIPPDITPDVAKDTLAKMAGPRITNMEQPKFTAAQLNAFPSAMFVGSSYGTGAQPIMLTSPSPQEMTDLTTLNATRAAAMNAGAASLTDTDRLNNPFAFDKASRDLQANRLADITARAQVGSVNARTDTEAKSHAAQNAAEIEKAKIGAQGHVDAARIQAAMHASPSAIRGQVLTELIKQHGNDPVAFRNAVNRLDEALASSGPGAKPAASFPQVPMTQAGDSDAPPMQIATTPPTTGQSSIDQAVLNARRDALPAIVRQGTSPNEKPTPALDPTNVNTLLDRLAAQNPTPEVVRAIAADIASGKWGEPGLVRDAIARSMASNYLLNQPPTRTLAEGGWKKYDMPATYHIPGLFKLEKGPTTGPLDAVGKAVSAGWASGIPYTQITLPSGQVIPFHPSDVADIATDRFGSYDQRRSMAPRRAGLAGDLVEALFAPR